MDKDKIIEAMAREMAAQLAQDYEHLPELTFDPNGFCQDDFKRGAEAALQAMLRELRTDVLVFSRDATYAAANCYRQLMDFKDD